MYKKKRSHVLCSIGRGGFLHSIQFIMTPKKILSKFDIETQSLVKSKEKDDHSVQKHQMTSK